MLVTNPIFFWAIVIYITLCIIYSLYLAGKYSAGYSETRKGTNQVIVEGAGSLVLFFMLLVIIGVI